MDDSHMAEVLTLDLRRVWTCGSGKTVTKRHNKRHPSSEDDQQGGDEEQAGDTVSDSSLPTDSTSTGPRQAPDATDMTAASDLSPNSDEGLSLDRQPSLTDLRSLDSESDSLAAAMQPLPSRRRQQGSNDTPLSGHRIHQSQSPPHHRLDHPFSGRQMSASTTFHGLPSLPGYTERKGGGGSGGGGGSRGGKDAPEAPRGSRHSDGHHQRAATSAVPPPVDYQTWSRKIVELQQMSDSLTRGIANFIRIAASSDPQYEGAVPPLVPNDRHGSTAESYFTRNTFDTPSSAATYRTVFSRTGSASDNERHIDTTNSARDNCAASRVSCTVTPSDIPTSADRYEKASRSERERVSGSPATLRCGSYLYRDHGGIRGPPQAGLGDTVDSFVTIATIPPLGGVGLDANEALKRQSAEVAGDVGGYRPGAVFPARRQCTGESGDFEPPGRLVNSETTSSVEMGHCSRNCICKEDCSYGPRISTEVYPKDLPTVTLFERTDDDVRKCTDSAVGVNFRATEEVVSEEVCKHDSSSTNETLEDSVCWVRGARSEAVISSRTSDFVLPDTGKNYTFPPAISGIDEMRAMLTKDRNANTGESSVNHNCRPQSFDTNGEQENERSVTDAAQLKKVEGEHDLKCSNKNNSSSSLSRESNSEPSYSLEQHFLPTTGMSYVEEVLETDAEREVTKINNDVEDELKNIVSSKDTLKKEHLGYNRTGSKNQSVSSVAFKTLKEDAPMENICVSTCALKTLLSGHGIMEDVIEMRKLSNTEVETNEVGPRLTSFRESTSGISRFCESRVQSDPEQHGRDEMSRRETCRTDEPQATEKDSYFKSRTSVRVDTRFSRTGNVADADLCDTSVTVLAAERDVETGEDGSRSATPTDECRGSDAYRDPAKDGPGDDSDSASTSASTSLFGGVVRRAEAAARSAASPGSASSCSSSSELIAPTNSFEDVPSSSRRSPVRYDARETLNLVRDLIWKESTYATLRPEHDTELPPALGSQQGAGEERQTGGHSSAERPAERAGAAADCGEPQSLSELCNGSGVRTVLQPRPHVRHHRSSQTCVAVGEFPNIPAADSLQRTLNTTNLKGTGRSPAASPKGGPASAWAARLHARAAAAPPRSSANVPSGWPAVSARPLGRPAGAAAAAGVSRSAGSSPRPPCSAYTREAASARSHGASARDLTVSRSKDATAADALLADAASLFRSKLEACDRRQVRISAAPPALLGTAGEQRRLQKSRPLSATPRLSAPAAGGPPTLLRMLRPGARSAAGEFSRNGRRQPLQEQDSWHQRQQQLQQRQMQLQQRQQQLQQRQLQLQQRQQMQQRQQLLQRQQRLQQTAGWQQRLNHTQVTKPTSRQPTSRTCRSPGAPEALSSAGPCDATAPAAPTAPGCASLRMLQARLRAGGSVHRGVAADEPPPPQWLPREAEAEADDEDCRRPTRDQPPPRDTCPGGGHPAHLGTADTCPGGGDPAHLGTADTCPGGGHPAHLGTADSSPVAVEPAEAEQLRDEAQAGSHDARELKEAGGDTDNCQAPSEAKGGASYGVCAYRSDISSLLSADFVNEDARLADLLPEPSTFLFVNYLPSAPVRERDEEDFIREIMLSGQGDVFAGSFDTLLLPRCVDETRVCDLRKSPDGETLVKVESEHLIEPPAEFCGDAKDGDGGDTELSSQSPEGSDCPSVSSPAGDEPEVIHTGDAGSKATCIGISGDSSIQTRGETDTSDNVATAGDVDKLAETVGTSSESGTDVYHLDEDNASLSHSSCSDVSSRESTSIVDSGRTSENLTEGQNHVAEENPLRENDCALFCCGLCTIQTTPLNVDRTNTACTFVADSCSPQETDLRNKCSNDETNAATGETAASEGSNFMDNSCTVPPKQPSRLSVGNVSRDECSAADSHVEQQVKSEERANDSERDVAGVRQDQNDIDNHEKPPSCSALPVTYSLVMLCDEATSSGSTADKPVRDSTDFAESNILTTEENEDDNKTIMSSSFTPPCESLTPTQTSEYTDCGNTTENTMGCPTEDRGSRNDCKTDIDNMVGKISVNLADKQSLSSLFSQGSSQTLWYTSTDDECTTDTNAVPKTVIQDECGKRVPCTVDAYGYETDPCLKQNILVDGSRCEKYLTDVGMVATEDKTNGYEDNNSNADIVSRDLQGEDSFRDAEDDSTTINSLNNDDLTDASSVSDPFSSVQFFSDSDEAPSTSVEGTATARRLPAEPSTDYVNECFNQLFLNFVRSPEVCALRDNSNEEVNSTDISNNVSSEVNEKMIPTDTEETSCATASAARAPETWSTETNDAQQTQVVDVITSATSWVTVSTVSSFELPADSSTSSLNIRCTQNEVDNSQEHVGNSSDDAEGTPDVTAYESYSARSAGLPVKSNISSLVITGAKIRMENTAEEVISSSNNEERFRDPAADANYTVHASELATEANISSLVVAGIQNKAEVKAEDVGTSSDNAEGIVDAEADESCTIQSCELATEKNISCLVAGVILNKAEVKAEDVGTSSDNAERILDAEADESCTIQPCEFAFEAEISSLDVADIQNKEEVNVEDVVRSSDHAERIVDVEEVINCTIDSHEVQAITSYLAIVGVQTVIENVENSLDSAERIRDTAAGGSSTMCFSELAEETNISPPIVDGTENRVEINAENVESSSDNADDLQDTRTHENYITASPELPVEANVGGAHNNLENIVAHVEHPSGSAGSIGHTTACESHTLENDTVSGKEDDGPCAGVSNEEISGEIPLGEPSTSWETLSVHSSTTDEDSADNTRESAVTTQPQQRRRRYRRDVHWRAARAEAVEDESRAYDLMLASPDVEVRLCEALSHSESEQPLLPTGSRVAALGSVGGPDAEVLVAALAGVALADADARADDAADILYGSRDLHSAAVEAAVACVVDSELRDLSALYVQRLGGCLLVSGEQEQQQPRPCGDTCQAPTLPGDDEASPRASPSITPPASPPPPAPGLQDTPSSCSLHEGAVADASAERARSHAIATLLTVCLFLAAYSSCRLIDPNQHVS
ncbi:uncharacterized protein LOC126282473 [Schistocerca gregaria]|uniref:uncharacterized protein LOC126282473 n=1 Tax=Schistocerca gregaria TaxID=7010 RepID=UPI00211DF184|nr:uncharacterized protein LOC126282473 [Schistocerca gregaria]